MKKKYTKKQIQEAINYWTKQLKLGNYKKSLNEGITFDSAQSAAEQIYSDIFSTVDTPKDLLSWAKANTIVITDNYGNDLYDEPTNLDKVKSFVQEIEWEHGDIDDEALKYEDSFKSLISAIETNNIRALTTWYNNNPPSDIRLA